MNDLFQPDQETDLPRIDSWPPSRHRFDEQSHWAVRAALASGRPLLLRGEPGVGKSQLARAVAHVARAPFLYFVVDERTERDHLLYEYDAVSRLAQAQLAAVMAAADKKYSFEDSMAEERFIKPGVLWWAFNWDDARAQANRFFRQCDEPARPKDWPRPGGPGAVVLIDEIDKADPSVPNGLLESLGNTGFQTAQLGRAVEMPAGGAPPLVFITTNEERELPAAFLRRCLVLHMKFPPPDQTVEAFLLGRARVHWSKKQIGDEVCQEIVRLLEKDRAEADKLGLARPGAAEFLDLCKVLVELHPGDRPAQETALKQVADYALKKNITENLS